MNSQPVGHSRPWHDEADVEAGSRVLRSQMTASGREASRFAQRLKATFDGRLACTSASGTLALMTALAAFDVGRGDDVIIPTYVCAEVLDAVRYVGARPVLCDVDAFTYAPSLTTVDAVIGPRCKAVVVPHMFGVPAAVDEIQRLGLPIIEDLAQGLGARLKGTRAGAWGDACILSFKAIKMISSGEGGAVVIRNREAARRLSRLHARRDNRRPAFDFPMSDVTAAVARTQFDRLGEFVRRRKHLVTRYWAALGDLSSKGVGLPADRPGCAWFRFPITLPRSRSPLAARAALGRKGIHVRRPVDALLHRRLDLPPGRFPVAERVFASTISLPLYPALTESDQDRVVDALRRFLQL